jgi:anaerobic C4-dicarboxylate transporter
VIEMNYNRCCHLIFGFAGGIGVAILCMSHHVLYTSEMVRYVTIISASLLIGCGMYGDHLVGDAGLKHRITERN